MIPEPLKKSTQGEDINRMIVLYLHPACFLHQNVYTG